MSVGEMGVVIFAANEGYLKKVAINKVLDFEAALLSYMNSSHGDLMKKINKTGDYSDEIAATFKSALDTFVSTQTW